MQTDRIELCQKIDAVDSAVDAVGNGDVDQPIFPCQWNSRLGPDLSERKKSCSFTTTENHGQHVTHRISFFSTFVDDINQPVQPHPAGFKILNVGGTKKVW